MVNPTQPVATRDNPWQPVATRDRGQWHKATMQAEWKGKTAGGCPQPANKNSKYNPQWLLKLTRPGHVFIQLEQAKPGFAPGRIAHEDLASIAIFLLKLKGKRLELMDI